MKKLLLAMLVFIIALNAPSFAVFAASYSSGVSTVQSTSGINVRKGAGTNYNIVGAAAKGVPFTVSKISNS